MVEKQFPDLHPCMTSTLLSLYLEHTLIALSGFPNGRKTVSRFTPLHDINIAEFIFGTYPEIFGSDFQRFSEIFGPLF